MCSSYPEPVPEVLTTTVRPYKHGLTADTLNCASSLKKIFTNTEDKNEIFTVNDSQFYVYQLSCGGTRGRWEGSGNESPESSGKHHQYAFAMEY